MLLLVVTVFSVFNICNRIVLAQVSITSHGDFIINQEIVLECRVTSFTLGASWSHDYGVNLLTQCFPGGLCTDPGTGTNYLYTSDSNGINVTIVKLTYADQGITWTCSHSAYNDSLTVPKPGQSKDKTEESLGVGIGSEFGDAIVEGVVCGAISACACISLICTAVAARKWYFSQAYNFRGREIFGIQIVMVAAFVQLFSAMIAVGVLMGYSGQYENYVTIVILLLNCVCPVVSVAMYLVIVAFCGRGDKPQVETKSCLPIRKTVLLMIIVILPLAWFVLLLLIFKNHKDNCTSGDEEQGHKNKDDRKGKSDKNMDDGKRKSDKNKDDGNGKPDKNMDDGKRKSDKNKDDGNGKPDKNMDDGKRKSDVIKDKETEKTDVKDVKEAGNQEQDTTDIGIQNVWPSTPKGGQLPSLPNKEKRNDEGKDPAQRGNKKRKRNKQKNAVGNDESLQYTDNGTDQIVTLDEDQLIQMKRKLNDNIDDL